MAFIRRQFFFFFITASIGICAGLAAVAFQYGSIWIFEYGLKAASSSSFWLFSLIALFLITTGALITGWLMEHFAPDAPGSGIPQVKKAYQEQKLDFSWSLLFVKFFGGILSIGTGSSLGREGPTIHIGAAIASKMTHFAGETKGARANGLCAGAAAGLAAAFHSPLSGVILILEEIAESQNMDKYAGRCLLASAISVSMVYLMTGDRAALPIEENLFMKWEVFWLSPLIAIFASFTGVFFQWATLSLRVFFKQSLFPLWMRPAIGALVGGVLSLIAFKMTSHLGVFGLGEIDLRFALEQKILWQTAFYLFIAKVFATIFCYGTGGCGGIFAPLIFFGAMSGVIIYGIIGEWLYLDGQDQVLLSLVGMTAALGSVVRAPLTSVLIVMEMTRQLQILPALMVAAVIAVFINRLFFQNNFYNQSLKQDRLSMVN